MASRQPPKLPHPGIYGFSERIEEYPDIASESNLQLRQYKDYIVSIMPLNDLEKSTLRALMRKNRFTPLESLELIRDCQNARNWEWDEGNDDHMLKVIKELFNMDWEVLADFLFIGMRASQCAARYEVILGWNEEWVEQHKEWLAMNKEWLDKFEEDMKRAEGQPFAS